MSFLLSLYLLDYRFLFSNCGISKRLLLFIFIYGLSFWTISWNNVFQNFKKIWFQRKINQIFKRNVFINWEGQINYNFFLLWHWMQIVMLDINSASEEELMTLTGITRTIAHEIIEHRNAIGAFKKVEDLALVSGVGAAKLQAIKPEICVGRKIPRCCSKNKRTNRNCQP